METQLSWTVLPLEGDIDLASAPALRARLAEATQDPPARVVLDMSQLDFIDSTGLGVLVGTLRRVRGGGGDVRIGGARPGIERVFSVTGLDRVFHLFPTVDEAVTIPLGEEPAPD
ncbi:MAG TPA: STAS domain-containing protein [Acidimicrobiales bacterium]|jgi:anti-sigma B factor antagonist